MKSSNFPSFLIKSIPLRKTGRYFLFLISALIFLNVLAAGAFANNYTVTISDDSGAGSLRQAVLDANAAAGPHTIVFTSGLTAVFLNSGEIVISTSVTITGNGQSQFTVTRSGAADFRIFSVTAGSNVTISDMAITGGRLVGGGLNGAGINNAGTLTLNNVSVGANSIPAASPSASTSNNGGGIYNTGTLSLTNSTVSGNHVGSPSVTGSIFTGGGGITNRGMLTLTNTDVSSNSADGNSSQGGGIDSTTSGSTLTIINSTISGNSTKGISEGLNGGACNGSGIFNAGTGTMTNTRISNNIGGGCRLANGGGIYNSGSFTISKTVFSGNTVTGAGVTSGSANGAGIYTVGGTLNLTESTISNNTATSINLNGSGGGMLISNGTNTLKNVTVANNRAVSTMLPSSGGGISNQSATTSLSNTIVADNVSTNGPNVSGGAVNSGGNNLISNTTGSSGWNGTDIVNRPARLAPLGNYGGPTPTIAISMNSPAINAGNSANAAATDQRGVPRIIGGTIDIGAFENNITISPTTLPTATINVPYNQTLTATRFESFGQLFSPRPEFLPPFVFSQISGSLPPGVTFSSSAVTGTPTLAGLYTFIVKATDFDAIASANRYDFLVACSVRVPFDFEGDCKTDISIYRPSNGEWWYQKSSNGQSFTARFGGTNDAIAPADFTGDNRTDFAVWRASTGEWFILRSEDFSYFSFPFGTNGDVTLAGDFDADGKADAGVFRPSNSTWYISKSSGGTLIQSFGQNGDLPVVSDYDGDGKSDIAIYRPSVGEWWLQRSAAGIIVFQFGNSSDKTVQGDFTGDAKSDPAFWRPSTGEWFVLRSEDQSFYAFPFGTLGDLPVPGDYDGDGKFDAAVFRPATSTWYVQRTTAGTLIQSFGQTGDVPVPSAFIR